MKYNVYRIHKTSKFIIVYVKRNKVDDSYAYSWIDAEWLNDKNFKHYTKASLNIFEAKKVISDKKALDRYSYPEYYFEYYIQQVKK